jgi:DNA repair protein RecO (recombination protein O)
VGVLATPAVLLRSHPYSETSRILRFYTRDAGLIGTMARGIRARGSKGRGGVESLAVGTLTIYVKPGRDLQTFRDFAPVLAPPSAGRGPVALACGSILAEIVLRHAGEDSNPQLFEALVEGLRAIAAARGDETLPVTLTRAWTIVGELGYQPELDACVACGRSLEIESEAMRFDYSAGGLRCPDCSAGVSGPRLKPETRRDLVGMIEGEAPASGLPRPRAHLSLLDDFVTYHLSAGDSLRSLGVLRDLTESDRG